MIKNNKSAFADLGLAEPILRALREKKYNEPTPIQAKAIPSLIKGKDILGIAQTGTGKTAAFTLPILHLLVEHSAPVAPRHCRALILAPTRELVAQIADALKIYGRYSDLHYSLLLGGVAYQHQIKALSRGVDILVATPGRLLDLVKQKHLNLSNTEFLVLDEADRMLDMGFINDVRKIVAALPQKRQSLLFSATMPKDIAKLAKDILNHPVHIEIAPEAVSIDRIQQILHPVPTPHKRKALLHLLTRDQEIDRAIIFTRTKHGANRVSEFLMKANIRNSLIHGNKSQGARQKALRDFKEGKVRFLIATDIAARGIDIANISHVINFDLPMEAESYVHRIGRTGRAGASGIAISFYDKSEKSQLRNIERLTARPLKTLSLELPETLALDQVASHHEHESERMNPDGEFAVESTRHSRGKDDRSARRSTANRGHKSKDRFSRSDDDHPRSFQERKHRSDRKPSGRSGDDNPRSFKDRDHRSDHKPSTRSRDDNPRSFKDRDHRSDRKPSGRSGDDNPRSFKDRDHRSDRKPSSRSRDDNPRSFKDRDHRSDRKPSGRSGDDNPRSFKDRDHRSDRKPSTRSRDDNPRSFQDREHRSDRKPSSRSRDDNPRSFQDREHRSDRKSFSKIGDERPSRFDGKKSKSSRGFSASNRTEKKGRPSDRQMKRR